MWHGCGENEPFYDLKKRGKLRHETVVGRLREVKIAFF